MFWYKFKAFMAKPFSSEEMDAGDWFLFVGLIVSILIAWKIIYTHIQEVA